MTHQLDMMPGALVDPTVLERIEAQMPKAREVKHSRLRGYEPTHIVTDDVGHELVLPERAREDHR